MNPNPTPEEAAEKLAATIIEAADRISEVFDKAAEEGVDPNTLRETARDELMRHGFSQVTAANIVRLAVLKANRRKGVETYTESELKMLCHRLAYG